MMKCDMCYDRTSAGKRPMCATVCPSQALAYVPPKQIARERREKPTNVFSFRQSESHDEGLHDGAARRDRHYASMSSITCGSPEHEETRRRICHRDRHASSTSLRRQFSKFLVLTSLGMFAGQFVDSCQKLVSVAAGLYRAHRRQHDGDRLWAK